MELRALGPTQREVAGAGQATGYIDRDAVATLQRGIDLGMTHIDTAEMYDDAELVVAEAMKGRREELFLVDKVLPQHASKNGTIVACERSLKRLGTERI